MAVALEGLICYIDLNINELSISGVPANVSDGYVYNKTFCYPLDEDTHQDFVNKTGEYLENSVYKIYRTVVVEQSGTKVTVHY